MRRTDSKVLDHIRSNAVAYLALFIALGGTGAWAADKITSGDIAKNAIRSKQIKKSAVKTAEIANRAVTAEKLADGVKGVQGPPGQDATNLFAYIRDEGGAQAASVDYGSGVTAVNDPPGDNPYTLTFSQALVNCAVHSQPAYGNPAGSASGVENAIPFVSMDTGDPSQITLDFETPAGAPADTAFLVTAFC